jgi:hypothetical protein
MNDFKRNFVDPYALPAADARTQFVLRLRPEPSCRHPVHALRRARGGRVVTRKVARQNYPPSEECAACFARGVFGYRKKTLSQIGQPSSKPGELRWFCQVHMPARHFADARRDK